MGNQLSQLFKFYFFQSVKNFFLGELFGDLFAFATAKTPLNKVSNNNVPSPPAPLDARTSNSKKPQ